MIYKKLSVSEGEGNGQYTEDGRCEYPFLRLRSVRLPVCGPAERKEEHPPPGRAGRGAVVGSGAGRAGVPPGRTTLPEQPLCSGTSPFSQHMIQQDCFGFASDGILNKGSQRQGPCRSLPRDAALTESLIPYYQKLTRSKKTLQKITSQSLSRHQPYLSLLFPRLAGASPAPLFCGAEIASVLSSGSGGREVKTTG